MQNKLLITGSNGLLGQQLVKKLLSGTDHYIYGVSRDKNLNPEVKHFKYFDRDLTDTQALRSLLEFLQPEVIFHTAAMTNVDACELNPQLCEKINVETVRTLVEYCKISGAHLIHISTDFVFDGVKGYYKETDIPNPLSVYGWSKLKSEELIKDANIRYTILRTILVFGLTRNLKNNIVLWLIRSLRKGDTVRIVTDQYRMPTLADDLADACIFAAKNSVTGTFHVSSNELMSIYDIAIRVADIFELDQSLIQPISTSALGQPAKRPPKTGFILDKSVKHLNLKPVSFVESLQLFKNQLKGISI